MSSIRDLILQSKDKKTKPINIPEWSVDCFVRSWSAAERNQFSALMSRCLNDTDKLYSQNMDARAVVMSLADADGNPIFTDKDLNLILEKNGAVVTEVARQCLCFNGIGNEKDIEKN